MIERHLIVKDDNKEVLILFINYNYEFAKLNKKGNDTIKKNINNYIKRNNIKFNGKLIKLAIGSILIATLIISNNNINFKKFKNEHINYVSRIDTTVPYVEFKEEKKEAVLKEIPKKIIIKKKAPTITKKEEVKTKSQNKVEIKTETKKIETSKEEKVIIYRNNGDVITLEIEKYVIGVVAAEMPASFNIEALKAQSILARTYALKSKSENKKLTDTVKTQVYIDKNQMKNKWGNDFNKYYSKIESAVNSTKGMYITYNNKYIDAVYHSTSNGYTEDAIEVWGYSIPYLKSVDSKWDLKASSYLREEKKDISIVLKLLGISKIDKIEIKKRDSSGRISEIIINNQTYSGVDMRELLSLRSTDFEIEVLDNYLNITTRGYGHGVGMSQYGANGMANEGYTYKQIINHYYKNISIRT